jgi:hypothetical protein
VKTLAEVGLSLLLTLIEFLVLAVIVAPNAVARRAKAVRRRLRSGASGRAGASVS